MRNIEVLRNYFLGKDPQLKEILADNSLRLRGIDGKHYVLRDEVNKLRTQLETADAELSDQIGTETTDRTSGDRNLQTAINNEKRARQNADSGLDGRLRTIEGRLPDGTIADTGDIASALANYYTKPQTNTLLNGKEDKTNKVTTLSESSTNTQYPGAKAVYDAIKDAAQTTEVVVNPLDPGRNTTVEEAVTTDNKVLGETQTVSEAISDSLHQYLNPEYFYRFKNLMDNSSFEVFDGTTLVPYGWSGGHVSADAAMFGTYSLKLEPGENSMQVSAHQPDVTWAKNAYDTNNLILSFYYKFGGLQVSVYDIVNASYLNIQALDNDLQEVGSSMQLLTFPYKANWNMYRTMIKITPRANTEKIRVEFICPNGIATREVYVDAPSLEPYVEGDYPSIYKDGRYSVSAAQIVNPPPGDVDRFTMMEHFNIRNGIEDANGFLTYQELAREDGSLAATRTASNPDANGFYQTVVETFYKADGVTEDHTDTYTYVFSSTGAIKQRTRS